MRTILKFSVLLLCFVPVARGQNPLFSGRAPVLEAGVAYSYLDTDVPTLGRLGMNGVQVIGNADFNPHFGVKLDVGYARSFDAFGSGHTADLLTYMGGPVFYPVRHRGLSIYMQALAGGARETGVNFNNGAIVLGFVNKFAWSAGAGFQYRLTRSFSLRAGADYLRTSFFTPNLTVQGQNTVRSSVGFIYTFGGRRE
jgi:opacity protein-like surface antigen